MSRNCGECRFALFEDYGYSNYTTEGTTFYCLRNAHPSDGFDRFYGRDDRLGYAAQCASFSEGEPVEMDVDGENAPYSDDPEVLDLLAIHIG